MQLETELIHGKVKTTAPKQYCVRPNSGRIEPGSEVEVQVLLQAMKEDPPLDARCRDKFLVQSIPITQDKESSNIAAIVSTHLYKWSNAEKRAKAEIQERKIRVVFLPADGTTSTPTHNNVNGSHLGDEAPPAYGSPVQSFGSPAANTGTPATRSTETSQSYPQDVKESASGAAATAQSTLANTASSVVNTLPKSTADLRQQLADVKAELAQTIEEREEIVQRQKRLDAISQDARGRITTGTAGMGVQQQPSDGVPVQIVAALCMLSFLLAYFFF
ncbi:MAG: hypothetical protein Q9191_002303 [Dirinaria sp. TL-2023a]